MHILRQTSTLLTCHSWQYPISHWQVSKENWYVWQATMGKERGTTNLRWLYQRSYAHSQAQNRAHRCRSCQRLFTTVPLPFPTITKSLNPFAWPSYSCRIFVFKSQTKARIGNSRLAGYTPSCLSTAVSCLVDSADESTCISSLSGPLCPTIVQRLYVVWYRSYR